MNVYVCIQGYRIHVCVEVEVYVWPDLGVYMVGREEG